MMLRFIPGVTWFIFITILFLLPGKELPQETWFEKIYLDKWVHSFFFFVLVYLFYIPLRKKNTWWCSAVMFTAMFYGIAIELIQHFATADRSFDIMDIVFDAIGCIIAYLVRKKAVKK